MFILRRGNLNNGFLSIVEFESQRFSHGRMHFIGANDVGQLDDFDFTQMGLQ